MKKFITWPNKEKHVQNQQSKVFTFLSLAFPTVLDNELFPNPSSRKSFQSIL